MEENLPISREAAREWECGANKRRAAAKILAETSPKFWSDLAIYGPDDRNNFDGWCFLEEQSGGITPGDWQAAEQLVEEACKRSKCVLQELPINIGFPNGREGETFEFTLDLQGCAIDREIIRPN